jgi:flagellar M-ring protein FliF
MQRYIDAIRNLPLKKRLALLFTLAAAIASVVLAFAWLQSQDYRILYSNLPDNDAGSVVLRLKEMGIQYKVKGRQILVPSESVYDLRLQLAGEGLPQGEIVGFELFDKTDFGATEFEQKLNYKRSLQGELARTVVSLSEVETARIHLAIPERRLFMEEDSRPSASVLLKLKPGRILRPEQVHGIVALVARSVEGLAPKDVSVINNRGEMLTRDNDPVSGMSSSQFEYRRNYEKDMESRIVGILEPTIGKGKVKAKVAAEIDFTRSEVTEERYDPDGQVVRSEKKNTEQSTLNGPGGVPGVASNLPGKGGAASKSFSGTKKQNETVNYEVSRITSHVVEATGKVKRITVAVLMDGIRVVKEGGIEPEYVPRTDEELSRYEELVKKAVGFDSERGDEVKVTNMPFEVQGGEPVSEGVIEFMPAVLAGLKQSIPILVIILLFLIVVRPLVKAFTTHVFEQPLSPPDASQIAAPQQSREIEHKQSVVDWAGNNPERAADLVRTWIGEK